MLSYFVNDDSELFDLYLGEAGLEIPGLAVKYVAQGGWVIRLLSLLATGQVFHIGRTVWFPSRFFVEDNPVRAFKILACESVYIRDKMRRPILYRVLYWLPEMVASLLYLAVLSIWYPPMILFLSAALLSVGISFCGGTSARTALAMRGYAMFVLANIVRHGYVSDHTRSWILELLQVSSWSMFISTKRHLLAHHIGTAETLVYNIDKLKSQAKDGTLLELLELYAVAHRVLTGEDRRDIDDEA